MDNTSALWLKRYKEMKQFQMNKGHCITTTKFCNKHTLSNWSTRKGRSTAQQSLANHYQWLSIAYMY